MICCLSAPSPLCIFIQPSSYIEVWLDIRSPYFLAIGLYMS